MSERDTGSTMAFDWAGERLVLCADRAVHHEPTSALFVADLHLGKPEHFRASGRPVPEEVTSHDLARLSALLKSTGARRLVVLGDLFHAPLGAGGGTLESFSSWRRAHPRVEMTLVRGNHDRGARRMTGGLDLDVVVGPHTIGPFACVHEPAHAPSGRPTLAGHLHPAVRLGRRFSAGIRSACFWFSCDLCVMPAFGRFTGARVIRPRASDRVVAVGDGALVEVTPRANASRQ